MLREQCILCGGRSPRICMHVQGGGSCRNAVNASVCRFCDYHVQGEYQRLNSSRGPLMTATVAAQLGSRAKAAGMQHWPSQKCFVIISAELQIQCCHELSTPCILIALSRHH